MLIIKIIVLLWVMTGTFLTVEFYNADESNDVFENMHGFLFTITVLSMIVIGPPIVVYAAIIHYMKRS